MRSNARLTVSALTVAAFTIAVQPVARPAVAAEDHGACATIWDWDLSGQTYHTGNSIDGRILAIHSNMDNLHSSNVMGSMADHGFLSSIHHTCGE
jgi:hypothetical protein